MTCAPRFERLIAVEVNRGSRHSKIQLLQPCLEDFHSDPDQKFKIYTDETKVMKFLILRFVLYRKRLTVQWGQEKPENTAVPLAVQADPAVQDAAPQPV